MATNVQSGPEASTTSLLAGILNDAQELFKHQLELFKAELKQDMEKAREGAALLVVGAGLSFVGLIVLAFALAHMLFYYVPTVPLWVWYALAGGGLAAIGVTLVCVVFAWAKKAKPLSETATGLEENVEWKTNPK
jgi:uncharacterized membrane protein YqjE